MLEAAVLAEALAVVADDDEDRILIEPELLVLIYELLEAEVLVADAVQLAVDQLVVGEILAHVALGGGQVVVVGGGGEVTG